MSRYFIVNEYAGLNREIRSGDSGTNFDTLCRSRSDIKIKNEGAYNHAGLDGFKIEWQCDGMNDYLWPMRRDKFLPRKFNRTSRQNISPDKKEALHQGRGRENRGEPSQHLRVVSDSFRSDILDALWPDFFGALGLFRGVWLL